MFGPMVCCEEGIAPVLDIRSTSVENFGGFVGILDSIFLVGSSWRVKISKGFELFVDRIFVLDMIEEFLINCFSNMRFNLSQLIFQTSIFFDLLVVVGEILVVLSKRFLSRLGRLSEIRRSVGIRNRCWTRRFLWFVERLMGLFRINVFLYVS